MARPFSFDNAAFHFARNDGPPGFLPKYLTAYAIGIVIIAVVGFLALRPLWEGYMQVFVLISQGASESQIERQLGESILANMGRLGLGYLAMLLVYAAFWSMMECAVLRRYVREEGFRIGWGADEWRMLAVGLIWMVAFIVAYIAMILATVILVTPIGMMAQDNPALIGLWTVLVILGLALAWAYFAVKFSPAGAMTIRDEKVVYFDAWGASKGRFWPMLGAFVILAIILYAAMMVLYMIGVFAVMGAAMGGMDFGSGEPDPDAVLAAFASPAVWVPLALIYFVMLVFQGFWQYAWAGVPALAAKTDPRTGGMHDAAEAF